tara:strand:- start:1856 stop:3331 length:1476 start_codon:yes stop_codon:yes gene_type:complete
MILGKVIATDEGPSVFGFSFVVDDKPVRREQYVTVNTEEGLLIGRVVNIIKTNRYFESIGAVKEFSARPNEFAFPTKEWEYTLAHIKCLGVHKNKTFEKVTYPPSPGSNVDNIDAELLGKFLGINKETGLNVGKVNNYDLPAKFDLTKMFQKHLAILAMSGSGKSYGTAVIIEELLQKTAEEGRVGIILMDSHGEYTSFKDDPNFNSKVQVIDASKIRLSTESVHVGIINAISNLSDPQRREMDRAIRNVRSVKRVFSIEDLVSEVRKAEMNDMVKEALLSRLTDISRMNLFSTTSVPSESELIKQGMMTVIDFTNILDLRKKQIIVSLISKKLFELRVKEAVPPYIEIIEEAHNFCPSGEAAERAISRAIIEKLAREGRKFNAGLCLISQRPVKLSPTALSQCNTQIILRITNPLDLDHIKASAEGIGKEESNSISSLDVGEALIIGEAVRCPVFFKFRERKSKEKHSLSMEDYAKKYESKTPIASGADF